MAFKGALIDSQAVLEIREEMVHYQIPVLIVVVAMPFIAGLITGITIGFVGATFPLLVPLFVGLSPLDFLLHASLAYVSGYVGMMLSPVHICLLVTKDYFKASLAASYRHHCPFFRTPCDSGFAKAPTDRPLSPHPFGAGPRFRICHFKLRRESYIRVLEDGNEK
jgi:hypothetical protein